MAEKKFPTLVPANVDDEDWIKGRSAIEMIPKGSLQDVRDWLTNWMRWPISDFKESRLYKIAVVERPELKDL